MLNEEYFTFDDVLILPSYSEIQTRESISTATSFLGLKLDIPIISSNMDYVTGPKMAIAMYEAGGLGILHRFMSWNDQLDALSDMKSARVPVAFSVGVREGEAEKLTDAVAISHDLIVCIDVAHGEHKRVVDMVKWMTRYTGTKIIAGNVATRNGFIRLAQAGAHAVKVGIGPGSICTTREVTGVGVPQLSAIMNVAKQRDHSHLPNVAIIADGGIKNSGDIVKALAAGADVVMLGSLLAGSSECPVETIETPDGHKLKPYRGQSIFGTNGLRYTPEGISGFVDEKGPVAGVLKQLRGGLRSGMSYVGAQNLEELRENAEFIRVSNGTHKETSTRVRTTF